MDDAAFLAHYGVTRAEAQDPDFSPNSELAHAGVKGMKWGVRKAAKAVGNEVKRAYKEHGDEVQAARNRIDSGAGRKSFAKAQSNYFDARDKSKAQVKTAKSERKSGNLSKTAYKDAVKTAKAGKKAAALTLDQEWAKRKLDIDVASRAKTVSEFLSNSHGGQYTPLAVAMKDIVGEATEKRK